MSIEAMSTPFKHAPMEYLGKGDDGLHSFRNLIGTVRADDDYLAYALSHPALGLPHIGAMAAAWTKSPELASCDYLGRDVDGQHWFRAPSCDITVGDEFLGPLSTHPAIRSVTLRKACGATA